MARDVHIDLGDHRLESGDWLRGDTVQGRLYGKAGAPVILIPGGISASRFIADSPPGGNGVGDNWWSELVGDGLAIDLTRYQVLGVDLAPSGSNSHNRLTITTADQAKRLAALLDHLDISQAEAAIGTSYGGMVLLALAQNYPNKAKRLCVLGAAHRPYPMGVAWRGIQRRTIELGIAAGRPNEGLKLARELAMTTYRSPEEFTARFTAAPVQDDPIRFDVGDYLEACGRKYHEVMPAERFMSLSQSIDLHKVDPQRIKTPVLLIATETDLLAPPSEIRLLRDSLAGPADMVTISSIFGHDSFLKESEILAPILADFVEGKRRAA